MAACLSDQELTAFADGSATPEQIATWKAHLTTCDSCAARAMRRTGELAPSEPDSSPSRPQSPPAGDPLLAPGTQLGDFRVERRIGAGGMGVVYQARQVSLNRTVALKVLPPGLGLTRSAVVRFRREAQAAGKLHHTNIVAIYAEGEEGGTCYYAMELIEGRGLDQIIANLRGVPAVGSSDPTLTFGPGISPPSDASRSTFRLSNAGVSESGSDREHFDTIARWMADAADALDYAHQQGVIHRDIKPSNLMLGGDRRVKLLDFGLARMLEEPGMTLSGEFLGTPRYMSPEQITAGRAKLDHRTDIYSLGATLYHLLTLHPPFPGEHRDEIIAAIMAKEPTRPRQIDRRVPVDLETICLKAIEKDPDRRYQTGGAMAEDLRRYLNRHVVQAKRVSPLGHLARFVRRQKSAVASTAAGIVIVVAVAAGLVWRFWPEPQSPPVLHPTLGTARPITHNPGVTTDPALSFDGTRLAYASDRSGDGHLDLWIQDLNERGEPRGEPTRLTTDPAHDHQPAFSRDGQQIAFRSERDGGGIYVIPVAGGDGKGTRVADLGQHPRFSPDGAIAYWVGNSGWGRGGSSM